MAPPGPAHPSPNGGRRSTRPGSVAVQRHRHVHVGAQRTGNGTPLFLAAKQRLPRVRHNVCRDRAPRRFTRNDEALDRSVQHGDIGDGFGRGASAVSALIVDDEDLVGRTGLSAKGAETTPGANAPRCTRRRSRRSSVPCVPDGHGPNIPGRCNRRVAVRSHFCDVHVAVLARLACVRTCEFAVQPRLSRARAADADLLTKIRLKRCTRRFEAKLR